MTASPSISAVIVSCNEADVIESCLQSVASWVDEIVVVDMHSTDGTRDIAQRYDVRLLDHEWFPFAEPALNYALGQANGDWILVLAPDERVPAQLAQRLRRIALEDAVDAVTIPFQLVVFGRPMQSPGVSDTPHARFFRKGVVTWPSHVHGEPDLTGLRCYEIPPQGSGLAIQHESWRSVSGLLDRIVRYAPKEVEQLRANGQQFSMASMLYAVCFDFVRRMALGRAYEDGMPGVLGALYSAIYQLTVYAELWEAEGYSSRYDSQIARTGRWLMWPLKAGYHAVYGVREGVRLVRRLRGMNRTMPMTADTDRT